MGIKYIIVFNGFIILFFYYMNCLENIYNYCMWRMEFLFDYIMVSCYLYIKEMLIGCRIMECIYIYDFIEEFIYLVMLDV